jgi:hypothetical protein
LSVERRFNNAVHASVVDSSHVAFIVHCPAHTVCQVAPVHVDQTQATDALRVQRGVQQRQPRACSVPHEDDSRHLQCSQQAPQVGALDVHLWRIYGHLIHELHPRSPQRVPPVPEQDAVVVGLETVRKLSAALQAALPAWCYADRIRMRLARPLPNELIVNLDIVAGQVGHIGTSCTGRTSTVQCSGSSTPCWGPPYLNAPPKNTTRTHALPLLTQVLAY